jgi:hypothetical protein
MADKYTKCMEDSTDTVEDYLFRARELVERFFNDKNEDLKSPEPIIIEVAKMIQTEFIDNFNAENRPTDNLSSLGGIEVELGDIKKQLCDLVDIRRYGPGPTAAKKSEPVSKSPKRKWEDTE